MGHLGIQKCRERAKKSFYWPGLSNDIQEEVSKCETCTRFANNQRREPLIPHEVPELPWYKVAMDIMEFRSHSYLVVVDCYSHFPELRLLKHKTAEDVVSALESIFAVHGVPVTVMADNMPFNSHRMRVFADEWGSSPKYPRSNGMAERYVQTIKLFFKKCEDCGDNVYRSLLAYRETPLSGCSYSPAEMLFNRTIRSNLPVTTATLKPVVLDSRAQLQCRQDIQKRYYDRGTQPLKRLEPGSETWIRTGADMEWSKGVVIDHHDTPRSYVVDNGQTVVRRNRCHLKPNITEPITSDSSPKKQGPLLTLPQQPAACPSELTPGTPRCDRPIAEETRPHIRRSQRCNRGQLPSKYDDFDMSH